MEVKYEKLYEGLCISSIARVGHVDLQYMFFTTDDFDQGVKFDDQNGVEGILVNYIRYGFADYVR